MEVMGECRPREQVPEVEEGWGSSLEMSLDSISGTKFILLRQISIGLLFVCERENLKASVQFGGREDLN